MALVKFVGLVWLALIIIFALFFIIGVLIEKNLAENHPIMKLWRKHVIAPDPEDKNWNNVQP